jgi:hypothetical protein
MRFSMAQFDPVDFNCTTARAALLPTTVDLAGYRIKKQAQPFAAPGFLGGGHSQAAVISCVVGGFPVLLPIPTIVSPRGRQTSLSRPAWLSLARGAGGRTEAGYISSCPVLLKTSLPSIIGARNRSPPNDSVSNVCGIMEGPLCFVFRTGKSHSF